MRGILAVGCADWLCGRRCNNQNVAMIGPGHSHMISKKDDSTVQYLRTVFDAIPLPTFSVDADLCIHDFNAAAAQLLGPEPQMAFLRRGGDALHCIHAEAKGCGNNEPCKDCVIRHSVTKALAEGQTHR